ncbi:hypothetical protein HNP55_003105 [Paucibacter oligotrophus]|uniref:DUF4440 domain-containing protein n=1 Tax=Roseateles oligotrophus TaxID=1769250 RepID=A0A840L9Y5_9BURK|nr:nuclear transport factor 2 family protein [Roseateles oligotrophus]MBB4844561.1 hypothetical protein [Roseateles oligotrophus]
MTQADTELTHLLPQLQALECELHLDKTAADLPRLQALLHPDFREIGYSGRSYQREEMLALLIAAGAAPAPSLHQVQARNFQAQLLVPGLVLLNYESAHCDAQGRLHRHSRRSSLWRLGTQGWQMQFHQGTPCADWAAANGSPAE